mgnify:CR=1 FL=1
MTGFDPDFPPALVRASPNFGPRRGGAETPRRPDMILLHYTGMPTAKGALERLCDADAEVSAHYLVDEGGIVTQMVPESHRAWHAGKSYWRGEADINSASIGIEIANPGHEAGSPSYPVVQMRAVARLCRDIIVRRGPASPGARPFRRFHRPQDRSGRMVRLGVAGGRGVSATGSNPSRSAAGGSSRKATAVRRSRRCR